MRRPWSNECPSAESRASPVWTVMRAPPNLREDRNGLERDLVILGHDAEPDRAALVLRPQLAFVDLQLRDEVLERHFIGVAGGLLRGEVLGVDPLVVIGLGLLRER